MRFKRVPTKYPRIESVAWMCDGNIAFTYWMNDKYRQTLATMSPDGSNHQDMLFKVDNGLAASPTNPDHIAIAVHGQVGIFSRSRQEAFCFPLVSNANTADGTMAWSHDGQKIGFIGFRKNPLNLQEQFSQIYIFDLEMQVVRMIESPEWLSQLNWHPHNQVFTYWNVGDSQTEFADLSTQDTSRLSMIVDYHHSPAGNGVAFVRKENDYASTLIFAVEGKADRILARYNWLHKRLSHEWLSISPDGMYVAFNGGPFNTNVIRLYSVHHDKVVALEHEDSRMSFDSPTWSPDSRRIAFATNSGQVQILDV